jgi:hypothetical protein
MVHNRARQDFPARQEPPRFFSRTPFAGPETALAATIVAGGDPEFIGDQIARPGARPGPSTTFQSLTRRLNDLRELVTRFDLQQEKTSTTKSTKFTKELIPFVNLRALRGYCFGG